MCDVPLDVIHHNIGHRHVHMLAGDVDDKICTLRHVHLQFQIAAVEGIESFSVRLGSVPVTVQPDL